MDTTGREKVRQLNRQAKALDALYHRAAMGFGMSDCAFWVLYVLLSEERDLTQQDLCEDWSFIKQTLNSAVIGLREKGYLVLEPVPRDKNRKLLRLTPAGRRYAEGSVMKVIRAEQAAMASLTEEEFQQLLALKDRSLRLLTEELEQLL